MFDIIKHIIQLILIAALTAVAAGCADPFGDDPAGAEATDCFQLSVSVPLTDTRAPATELNEFRVERLHLYFFKAEGHDDAISEYVYDYAIDTPFEYSGSFRISLPADALEAGGLFGPTSSTCLVYAAANVDESRLTGKTVNDLKATPLESSFDKTEVQDRFAMDGEATLSLNRDKRLVTGTIPLTRSAAKITLAVDLPQSIEVIQKIVDPFDGSVTEIPVIYHSHPDEMRIWLANGVKSGPLNTLPAEAPESSLFSNEIYAAEGVGSPFTLSEAMTDYRYVQDIPFYSYPHKWNPYSPKGNCYLTLVIPWHYDDNGRITTVVTYYRISVRPTDNFIERNRHYDMRVKISRLGGMTVQTPVDMLIDWDYNMEWNVQTLPTDIKEIRYLLLNNNNFSQALDAYSFIMSNEESISIPINTSHPVEIESVRLRWRDFYNDEDRDIPLYPASGGGTYKYSDEAGYNPQTYFAGIEIDPTGTELRLTRNLVHIRWNNRAEITTEKALNAYTFTIKLRHKDGEAGEPSSEATVVVTQYPSIYISTSLTASGTRFINDNNTTYRTSSGGWRPTYTYYGYLNDNSPTNTTQLSYWLGSLHDEAQYVKNKHTYVLTISKFDTGDNYIIADPRTRTVDNLNPTGTAATAEASWTMNDRNSRKMRNYYPADRNASKARFIAPKIRVASQWGVTYQMTRTGAERRCATYQEDGRPAGRWRLPTPAEIEYISNLSNKEYIPYLFGSEGATANYWCATGGINVYNTETPSIELVTNPSTSEKRSVRCVYDEWYWATDTLTTKNRFTWGDRARSASGN